MCLNATAEHYHLLAEVTLQVCGAFAGGEPFQVMMERGLIPLPADAQERVVRINLMNVATINHPLVGVCLVKYLRTLPWDSSVKHIMGR